MKFGIVFVFLLTSNQISLAQIVNDYYYFTSYDIEDINALSDDDIIVDYNVNVLHLESRITDDNGTESYTSGLVLIPNKPCDSCPLLCFQNGEDYLLKEGVNDLFSFGRIARIYAGLGYVVVMPDYNREFPDLHSATQATSAINLMRAARQLGSENFYFNYGLSTDVYLAGYGQGAHGTMALQRMIESEFSDEFKIIASSAMSGPYDMSDVMMDYTHGDIEYTPLNYLVRLYLDYKDLYPLGSLDQLFRPIFVPFIQFYFDGNLTLRELEQGFVNQLKMEFGIARPRDLLLPGVLNSIMTDTLHPFGIALRDNDIYDWAPKANTNMYYCLGDEKVPYENAIVSEEVMRDNGSRINAIQVDSERAPLSHKECILPSVKKSINYFKEVRFLTNNHDLINENDINFHFENEKLVIKMLQKPNVEYTLSINSITGQNIYQSKLNTDIHKVLLPKVNSGIYIAIISGDNGFHKTQKFVKP